MGGFKMWILWLLQRYLIHYTTNSSEKFQLWIFPFTCSANEMWENIFLISITGPQWIRNAEFRIHCPQSYPLENHALTQVPFFSLPLELLSWRILREENIFHIHGPQWILTGDTPYARSVSYPIGSCRKICNFLIQSRPYQFLYNVKWNVALLLKNHEQKRLRLRMYNFLTDKVRLGWVKLG